MAVFSCILFLFKSSHAINNETLNIIDSVCSFKAKVKCLGVRGLIIGLVITSEKGMSQGFISSYSLFGVKLEESIQQINS